MERRGSEGPNANGESEDPIKAFARESHTFAEGKEGGKKKERRKECTNGDSGTVGFGRQGCQMAKFDPLLSLDCARVEGMGTQSKERKGSNFAA